MSEAHESEAITLDNESKLEELAWTIEAYQGKFLLIFARCNYINWRSRLIQRLQEICPLKIQTLTLNPDGKVLYNTIRTEIGTEQLDALMVLGLESVHYLEQMLAVADQVREEFRKNFPFPLVFWVNDQVYKKLMELAPNLESWGTSTNFIIEPKELVNFLKEKADQFFADNSRFTHDEIFNLALEIEAAQQDWQNHQIVLNPEIEAILESLLGFTLDRKNIDSAIKHYQKSLQYWRKIGQLERQGKLLSHIAFCYYIKALQNQQIVDAERQLIRDNFQQSLHLFEQAKRPDLVANSILAFGRVLRWLQDWEQLKILAEKALEFHQTEDNKIKIAEDYGFLAEVALAQNRWNEANQLAQKALEFYTKVGINSGTTNRLTDKPSRFWFILAKTQQHQRQLKEAIKNLEIAKLVSFPPSDIQLYLDILTDLKLLYFQNQEYLKAFEIKQEKQRNEQQYRLRAFIGANRIDFSNIDSPDLCFPDRENLETIAPEIIASGRKQDVERLIERIKRYDYKLTVIYGDSGVGKSSLINGGLVPTLQQTAVAEKEFLPVLIRVYTDWVRELGERVKEALAKKNISLTKPLNTAAAILEQLQQSEIRNLRIVLIFDQFEEFFFIKASDTQRDRFFLFIGECLKVLSLKVILSLRKDYLHHLLDIPEIKNIDNGILSQDVLYRIGNFIPEDAKAIIKRLTERSRFYLEDNLIDQLVNDLTDEGQVRPIELQIVGAQLQEEKIQTLIKYQQCGTKEELVKRYLYSVVKDCGQENEQVANLVLYLLTDEQGIRPLKTREDLETDLKALAKELTIKAEQLSLVLNILVESGLVFLIPETPANRYQLVHDYLVSFIREQQEPKIQELISQLNAEIEQRKRSEKKLERVVKANEILAAAQQQARHIFTQRRRFGGREFISAIGIATITITFPILFMRQLGGLEWLELASYDYMVRLKPDEPPDPRLLVVGISESDIQQQNQWPLSDRTVARLLKNLQQYQPKVIGLNLFRDVPHPPGHEELLKELQANNVIFVNQLGLRGSNIGAVSPPPLVPRKRVGFSNVVIDPDNVLRRNLMYVRSLSGKNQAYSFALQASLLYLADRGIKLQVTLNSLQIGQTSFKRLKADSGGYRMTPSEAKGWQTLLDYRSQNVAWQITLEDALHGKLDPRWVRDKVVLIGVTAPSAKDGFITPYSAAQTKNFKMPGVIIHAQMVSQILSSVLDERPLIKTWKEPMVSQILSSVLDKRPLIKTWEEPAEWLWIYIWSVVGAILGWRFWTIRSSFPFVYILLFAEIGLIGVCFWAFVAGWWLPLIPSILTLILSALMIQVGNSYQLEKFQLERTLELIVDTYSVNPADGRIAVDYCLQSARNRKFATEILNKIAINLLQTCQSRKDIARIAEKLAWIPQPFPDILEPSIPRFLEISLGVRVALETKPPEQQQTLLEKPITTLRRLHKNLTFRANPSHTKTLRKIAQQWLTILQSLDE